MVTPFGSVNRTVPPPRHGADKNCQRRAPVTRTAHARARCTPEIRAPRGARAETPVRQTYKGCGRRRRDAGGALRLAHGERRAAQPGAAGAPPVGDGERGPRSEERRVGKECRAWWAAG